VLLDPAGDSGLWPAKGEHHLATSFTDIVRDEVDILLADGSALTWDRFAAAHWRAVRRIVLASAGCCCTSGSG